MIYFISFSFALVSIMLVVFYGKVMDSNNILFNVVVAVGNGGFYALATASNLSEAILANKVSYALGSFAPMLLFFVVCSICQMQVPRFTRAVMYCIQIIVFFSACSVGKSTLFYKLVEYHKDGNMAYLTKTYGPFHSLYLGTVLFYTLAAIVVGIISVNRKNYVSRFNVMVLIFVDLLVVGVYLIERFISYQVELLPIFFTAAAVIITVTLIRHYRYSIYNNKEIVEENLNKTGFVMFNEKLQYMGCNNYATELLPELLNWELEQKVPGSGGRFNTFLRRPLNNYVGNTGDGGKGRGTYSYKGRLYRYEIGALHSNYRKRVIGYVIQLSDVTDFLTGETYEKDNGQTDN